MEQTAVTYLCPNCGAYLCFDGKSGRWVCEYCDGTFEKTELEQRGAESNQKDTAEKSLSEAAKKQSTMAAQEYEKMTETEQDAEAMRGFVCPSCGAEIVTDAVTAATFCVFCGNPTVLPTQLQGRYRPTAILPFETNQEDAKKAFLKLCKGKKLLPKGYTEQQRLEKITGVYVPFWLFDCKATFDYRATGEQVSSWSDSRFLYTKTDRYQIHRVGEMTFEEIPFDASEKMQDDLMDALEPFDIKKKQPFDMRYLSGFLAEKYSYEPKDLYERMTKRLMPTVEQMAGEGRAYDKVYGIRCHTEVSSDRETYVLLPVWMLVSTYGEKTYLFAMNGQTGKIVGELPISSTQVRKWFCIIFGICFLFSGAIALFLGGGF